MATVENKLKEMEIEYVKCRVEEGGIYIDQLFFHDPDGCMIEICNCDNLPVIPLVGDSVRPVCSRLNCNVQQQQTQQQAAIVNQQQQAVTNLVQAAFPAIPVQEDYLHCAWIIYM